MAVFFVIGEGIGKLLKLLKELKHFCIYRKENGSYKPFVPLATSSYIRNPMFCKWCQTVSDFPLK
jgi:hypothetical protein